MKIHINISKKTSEIEIQHHKNDGMKSKLPLTKHIKIIHNNHVFK